MVLHVKNKKDKFKKIGKFRREEGNYEIFYKDYPRERIMISTYIQDLGFRLRDNKTVIPLNRVILWRPIND